MTANVFEDVAITYRDKSFTIPARKVLEAIARIEQHITLAEIIEYSERNAAPLARLSRAYGSVLRYAGKQISDDDVYAWLASGMATVATEITTSLLMLMVPPSERQKLDEGAGEPPPNPGDASGNASPTAARSSRSATRRRSGRG